MTFGELVAQLFGWLGEFIEWLMSWVPRYTIVQYNERGVKYVRGKKPTELLPGIRWYWPITTDIEKHHTNRSVVNVAPLTINTKDGKPCVIGMVVTGHITDVLKYEVENLDADESMAEVARAGLRNIVTEHRWEELGAQAEEGNRLEKKLTKRMGDALQKFGFTVESCRPTDQVLVPYVVRAFGVNPSINVITSGT